MIWGKKVGIHILFPEFRAKFRHAFDPIFRANGHIFVKPLRRLLVIFPPMHWGYRKVWLLAPYSGSDDAHRISPCFMMRHYSMEAA